MKKEKLIPPDLKQCQAEKSNAVTFAAFCESPTLIRCTSKSLVIITEKKKPHSAMSLCLDCWQVAIKQLGANNFMVKPI